MPGTKRGGLRAAATNKARHGQDFYKTIAKLSHAAWRANGRKPRGFSVDTERASAAGRKGGLVSRRGKAKDAK